MSKRLYLSQENDIFLMKLEIGTIFVDGEDSEYVVREDIPFLIVFGISKEVLEDFFDN